MVAAVGLSLLGAALLLVGAALVVGAALAVDTYGGASSDHFDGERFRNREATPLPSAGMGVKLLRSYAPGHWDDSSRWTRGEEH